MSCEQFFQWSSFMDITDAYTARRRHCGIHEWIWTGGGDRRATAPSWEKVGTADARGRGEYEQNPELPPSRCSTEPLKQHLASTGTSKQPYWSECGGSSRNGAVTDSVLCGGSEEAASGFPWSAARVGVQAGGAGKRRPPVTSQATAAAPSALRRAPTSVRCALIPPLTAY